MEHSSDDLLCSDSDLSNDAIEDILLPASLEESSVDIIKYINSQTDDTPVVETDSSEIGRGAPSRKRAHAELQRAGAVYINGPNGAGELTITGAAPQQEPTFAVPLARKEGAKFNMNVVTWFLTWPNCTTEKITIHQRAMERWGEHIAFMMVSAEKHQNGEPHLHAVIHYKKRFNMTNVKHIDNLAGKHGNYQRCRNLQAAIQYLRKEDPEPFIYNNSGLSLTEISSTQSQTLACKLNKKAKRDVMADALKQYAYNWRTLMGQSSENLAKHGLTEGDLLFHGTRMKDYAILRLSALEAVNAPQLPQWKNRSSKDNASMTERQLCTYSNQMAGWLTKGEAIQKHLWLWGSTGTGKSTFVSWLSKWWRIYEAPLDNWWDGYNDDDFDIVWFDEVNAEQRPVTALNSFMDKPISATRLRNKGGWAIKKKQKVCIFTSNARPDEVFNRTGSHLRDALERRLLVIQVDLAHEIDQGYINMEKNTRQDD